MKRHIYLNMKSVEEAREIFLARFDLDHVFTARGDFHRRGLGPGHRGSGICPAVLAPLSQRRHGRLRGGGRNYLWGQPG